MDVAYSFILDTLKFFGENPAIAVGLTGYGRGIEGGDTRLVAEFGGDETNPSGSRPDI
jgi:hypothetical protein